MPSPMWSAARPSPNPNVRVPGRPGLRAELVAEPDVLVVVQVCKHAVSRKQQRRGRATHCTAQHAYCVCDVRTRLCGTVGRRRRIGFGRQRFVQELGQVVCSGCVRTVHGGGYAVGQECADHVRDVTGRGERHMVIMAAYFYVEEVRDRALVLHIPSRGKRIGEGCVQRAWRVVVMQDE
eukprot:6209758-Pleurochrysis_carterae.AAC.1